MSLRKILFNRSELENPAKINLKNIKRFIVGNVYRFISFLQKKLDLVKDNELILTSRTEQVTWRRKQIKEKSPECFEKGECYCGCELEGIIWLDDECEEKNKCYPRMMSPEEWEKFKFKNKV